MIWALRNSYASFTSSSCWGTRHTPRYGLNESPTRDKIRVCLYFTGIKNVFRTYDEHVARERLERLLDDYDDIPRVLPRHIQKKILPGFDRLMIFLQDGLVSKTTNPLENYYRQTDPESTKKKYKTTCGVLSHLARKMEYWTVKLGRLPQPPTS